MESLIVLFTNVLGLIDSINLINVLNIDISLLDLILGCIIIYAMCIVIYYEVIKEG